MDALLPHFAKNSPWLILAPHLMYPTRNGADISLDRLARSVSHLVPYVDLIAVDRIYRFRAGKIEKEVSFKNAHRSKAQAALRTICFNDHYFKQKFNTPHFLAQSRKYLADPVYKTVLFSYLTTASLLAYSQSKQVNRLHMVWTHNDEFRWFVDIEKQASNPLIALTAQLSQKWLHRFMTKNQKRLLFLHVSDEDMQGFRRSHPEHIGMRVSIGVDVQHDLPVYNSSKLTERPVRLVFMGSLSMKMNEDALINFAETYLPILRTKLPFPVEVRVVGSNPTEQVTSLCQQMAWELHKNVSDEQLRDLLVSSDFSLMPFTYINGAKLKLLNSLAHGLPFLGTKNAGKQLEHLPQTCLAADEPDKWVSHIKAVRSRINFIDQDRITLLNYAHQYSWDVVTEQLFNNVIHLSSHSLTSMAN